MANPYMVAHGDVCRRVYPLSRSHIQDAMAVTDSESDIGRKEAIVTYCNVPTLYHCEFCLAGNGRMLTEFNPSTIILNVQGDIIEV